MEDGELLRQYVQSRSDTAFAELVRRHVDLVYSTALRVAREPQMAKDIAQAVFIDLARKAGAVRDARRLSGWLYRTTRYEAASAVRAEQRRRFREAEAMKLLAPEPDTPSIWTAVEPWLEQAMGRLNQLEQDALLLHFFENKTLSEVGQRLGLSEEAARKRVSRALDKLRDHFARRGLKLASGALASAIAARAVQAAPTGLAPLVAGGALVGAAAAGPAYLASLLPAWLMTKTAGAILALLALAALVAPSFFSVKPPPAPAPQAPARPKSAFASPEPVQSPPTETVLTPAKPAAAKPLLARVADLPPLTAVQIESYLEQNKRNAESLLAAYRVSTNAAYLSEAATRYPNNPEVQYAVVTSKAAPDALRAWMDAYKASSSDNALAWYFSAWDHFRAGQTAPAVQEVLEATRKPAFRADLAPTLQAVEELNRSAGRAADEAQAASFYACAQIPHLPQMKELAKDLREALQQYRSQNDTRTAESLAGAGLVLGAHLSAGAGSQTVINQLVGTAIEKMFLQQLEPTATQDPFGRPVADLTASIQQHQATLKDLAQALAQSVPTLNDTELATYFERVKLYGEEAALTWLKTKHGTP